MKLSEIAPELRGKARWLPRLPLERAWGLRLVRWGTTRARPAAAPDVDVEVTPGWRVYRPREPRSDLTLLWIHGGGLVIGAAVQDDRFCADTARELGITVVSAEYRLAPEARYPAALDDCHAAWTWTREHAADPARVIVGGQSAGGGLAAALVQRLRDAGERPPAQWLFCPMLDDRTTARPPAATSTPGGTGAGTTASTASAGAPTSASNPGRRSSRTTRSPPAART